jgi:glycosyltransferase involved in cell wall biosynthesis
MKTIVATITFDRGHKDEANKIIKTMKSLRSLGYDVVAVDSGSSAETVQKMKELGVDVRQQAEKGVGSAIKESVQRAYQKGADIIVYMEGDKYMFGKHLKKVIEPVASGRAAISIPSRDWKSYKVMPMPQLVTEGIGIALESIAAGKYADYIFGPRAFTRDIAPMLIEYKGKDWGALHYGITKAARLGHKVERVSVSTTYPMEDVGKEKLRRGGGLGWKKELKPARYRLQQLRQNIRGIRAARKAAR